MITASWEREEEEGRGLTNERTKELRYNLPLHYAVNFSVTRVEEGVWGGNMGGKEGLGIREKITIL